MIFDENMKIVKDFKSQIDDKANQIDPNDELCWLSLTVGWALAQGYSPTEAREFSIFIRYKTDMG